MGSTPEPDLVFVSYARVDAEFALKLARDLRLAGVSLWVDQLDLSPGERWDQATEQALNICQTVLVILSPAAVASANVMDEVSFALDERKQTVPVICRKCKTPLRLRRLEFVDFTTPNYEASLARLVSALVRRTSPATLDMPIGAVETSLVHNEAVEANEEAVRARTAPAPDVLQESALIQSNTGTNIPKTTLLSNGTSPRHPDLPPQALPHGAPALASDTAATNTSTGTSARARFLWHQPSQRRGLLAVVGIATFLLIVAYHYAGYIRVVDTYLNEKHDDALPRLFPGAIELHSGASMTLPQLVDRLNDAAYVVRPKANKPGEFEVQREAIAFISREAEFTGQTIRATFQPQTASDAAAVKPPQKSTPAMQYLQLSIGSRPLDHLTLESPKTAAVVLSDVPECLVHAVLAIEESRSGNHNLLISSITTRLAREIVVPRIAPAIPGAGDGAGHVWVDEWTSLALAQRASRDQILERYLNDLPVGRRGSYMVVGVGQAARLFFGKDIRNIALAEAAAIAGMIQSPLTLSPFTHPSACRDRRNEVLAAMVDSGYLTQDTSDRASREPLAVRISSYTQGAVSADSDR